MFSFCLAGVTVALALLAPAVSQAASFNGNARVEIADSSGGLSWVPANGYITVECWFKISVASGQSISQDMTILVDRRTGTESTVPYAYLIKYNVTSGRIEFLTRNATTTYGPFVLIQRPYLDRWYHVAVVRQGSSLYGYVDGRPVFTDSAAAGDTVANTDGVSIGGWGAGRYFYGEIQEVRIHQQRLLDAQILNNMFKDLTPATWPNLKGYYKLAYSASVTNNYRNFAQSPPAGSNPGGKQGTGTITFDEVSKDGEQSIFDSQKNGGEGAISPVSGAFVWEHPVFSRPTPGIAFDFRLGYSSANAYSGYKIGTFDLWANSGIGKGWRHSFETRMIPEQASTERRVLLWNGSVETWVRTGTVYRTQHKEYRGELRQMANWDFEWCTPDRVLYRFKDPTTGDNQAGLLYEVVDYNSNTVRLLYGDLSGLMMVTQVVDTASGKWKFQYNTGLTRLTNIVFGSWSCKLEYNNSNQLSAHSIKPPAGYSNVNTRWQYAYTNGVMVRIRDPRGNSSVMYVQYDKYGRKEQEQNAGGWTTYTEYDTPARHQIRIKDSALTTR